ncbi:MAG: MSMEG_6728 family protein [Clostridia bacterium]
MNTFLPYPDFKKSAQCLDNKRLGKQRVEVYQIIRTLLGYSNGWKNHPAIKMWKGYESALALYGLEICKEWVNKGFKDSCTEKINKIITEQKLDIINPKIPFWLGSPGFHASQRSNLLRKFLEHYSKFDWRETDNLPYVWPV